MALKDLLVLVGRGMEAAGVYALSLSAACGASLTAAAPIIEPSLPPNLAAEFLGGCSLPHQRGCRSCSE